MKPNDETYCYEDELPCELTAKLFGHSLVDGVRLYPWWAVAAQLKSENEALKEFVYLVHSDDCPSLLAGNEQCDCGYNVVDALFTE